MAQVSEDLGNKAFQAFSLANTSGKIRKGTNEVTKAIERGKALFVGIAKDVSPPEIVAHLPVLCEEKDIPYIFVEKREELGKSAGLSVSTSALAIVEAGEAKSVISELSAGKAPKKEAPKEEKKEEKKEEVKEEKKEEKKEEPKEEVKEEKTEEKKEEKAEENPEEAPKEEKPEEKPEEAKEEKPEAEKKEGEEK